MNITRLISLGCVRNYPADEIICYEGEPGHEMYVVLTGTVNVLINSIDGFPITVARLGPGDFFGEMSLLEGQPRSASVQAAEEVHVMALDENNFEKILCQEPLLALRIMKGLSSRIRNQNKEMRRISRPRPVIEQPSLILAQPGNITSQITSNQLLPPLHKSYDMISRASDEEYLFEKDVICPICTKKFTTKMVRSSRLRINRIDMDFRQRYNNFEPLWYIIWVCPHCLYANFHFEFHNVPVKGKQAILKNTAKLKSLIDYEFTTPRTIDQVFNSYYLALHALNTGIQDLSKIGCLWLRLSWLYCDVRDEEMFRFTSNKALDYFNETFYKGKPFFVQEQNQRLCYLIGELYLRIGSYEQALTHFRKSIINKNGNKNINQQARDRVYEIKKLL